MTLTLSDNEYRMLQTLTVKGLQTIEKKVGEYSDPSVPTYFRNRCNEELRIYREFVLRLNKGESYDTRFLRKS